jgi:transposase
MMQRMAKQIEIATDLGEMSHAEKDALIQSLLERLSVLEGMLQKDSHNSSKPPSSDGMQRKPKSLRRKSGAKVGGQRGHDGVTLKRSNTVDRTVIHPLALACDVCGAPLAGQASTLAKEIRQIIDLPPIRFEVTEHRLLRAQCQCGARHCSAFPEEVSCAVQYGSGVKAASPYLTQYQQLPIQRCADAMRDLLIFLRSCLVQCSPSS